MTIFISLELDNLKAYVSTFDPKTIKESSRSDICKTTSDLTYRIIEQKVKLCLNSTTMSLDEYDIEKTQLSNLSKQVAEIEDNFFRYKNQ